jgi:endogenous inhibitor of DNA gyrase (YacG/DUF329 family)
MSKCPICSEPAAPRATNAAFPFCGERCRLIDLGKWLGEEYRIPTEDQPDEDEQIAAVSTETPRTTPDPRARRH